MTDAKTGKTIPGTVPVEGREFLYVAEGRFENPTAWFRHVTEVGASNRPRSGGVLSHNCRLRTPDSGSYLAISYKGDVQGWRTLLLGNLDRLQLGWAMVEGEMLRFENRDAVPFSACSVEFYTI